jgi:hypothetical protein
MAYKFWFRNGTALKSITLRLTLFQIQPGAKAMVLTQTDRQVLVSGQTANILSNFLAIFLALAAKNIYNVVRRILRVRNQSHEDKTQVLDAGITGPDGSDDSVTEPTGFASQSPAIRTQKIR